MRVAISVTSQELDPQLDERFGRCPFFQIIDEETKQASWIPNQGIESNGGAGIAAAQQILNEKIDVLITGKLGPHAWDLLSKSGIQLFEASTASVSTILATYHQGRLESITSAKKGGNHGHGHGNGAGQGGSNR
ncbi:NifB/NifX family molybdenum-iron cluster-binding protein [Rubeoparvulum massiliense]|uniref:NifB/NifX family molybdenum-iron cluster-binding protein n=1 Tax=Rubeoparvulum massiliense TaxID=1631346 RepID=UPI00065DE92B|nr:NifB/NifX family molybdenum-iron cluster-binding protein [Rubeoparvulum massiliense]